MSRSSRRCISRLVAASLLSLVSVLTYAQSVSHRYTVTRGAASTIRIDTVSRDAQGIVVSASSPDSRVVAHWTSGIGTTEWQWTDAKTGDTVRARRSGNVIHITGTLGNIRVEREDTVDPAPWYQIFGPLLEELFPAGSSQGEFWVLDPTDFAAHKMQVKRAGTERVTIKGTAFDAAKVHFAPAGILAAFWGADFWMRLSDGLYVSSRLPEQGGTAGFNGVAVSTIEDLAP